jgi:hypothetical protein
MMKGQYKQGKLIIGGREFSKEDFEAMKKVGYKAYISQLNKETVKFEEEITVEEMVAGEAVVEEEVEKPKKTGVEWAAIPRHEIKGLRHEKKEEKKPWYKRIFKRS